MEALVQAKALRAAPCRAIEAQLKPIEASSKRSVRPVGQVLAHEPHAFPDGSTSRALPVVIRDEMLEFYALVFCQGGFHQLGMTFEQFLLVAAAIKPADFPARRESSNHNDPQNCRAGLKRAKLRPILKREYRL
jgi:hypothetical protein